MNEPSNHPPMRIEDALKDARNFHIRKVTEQMQKLKKKNGKPYKHLQKQLDALMAPAKHEDNKLSPEELELVKKEFPQYQWE